MVRNFREEAYRLMVEGVRASGAADVDGALHDASERVGEAIKLEEGRARNFELMLVRVVRRIKTAKSLDQLDVVVDQAADLLARIGTGPFR